MRWLDRNGPGLSRHGGAGPSDHKAVTLGGETVMVPIFTHTARESPYSAEVHDAGETASLFRSGVRVAEIRFPRAPRFYALSAADGTPYWKIATLHARDVLATTVLQTCTRYGNRSTSCQFCAIGQSLAKKATIAEKTPAMLAEVAKAARDLDHVAHVVLTTGTPATPDRGASVLADAARAIRDAAGLPIQAQCEPPADFRWFGRLAAAGVGSLGMHLEAVTERVRQKIMPGKAEVPLATYFEAFAAAVEVFGRGQVSTYILAGLGDTELEILEVCRKLVAVGVYPFVVPFVPIAGTPLERHPAPRPEFMQSLLGNVAELLAEADMKSSDIKAGCGRCGACSSLRAREAHARA
jgi:radical SAM protein (TIGR04043 family)